MKVLWTEVDENLTLYFPRNSGSVSLIQCTDPFIDHNHSE